MQKDAMALGYFSLAVFCIFTSSQGYLPLQMPLLIISLLAALMGIGFLMSAWAAQFQTVWRWWLQMVRLGQQAPINGRSHRPPVWQFQTISHSAILEDSRGLQDP